MLQGVQAARMIDGIVKPGVNYINIHALMVHIFEKEKRVSEKKSLLSFAMRRRLRRIIINIISHLHAYFVKFILFKCIIEQ